MYRDFSVDKLLIENDFLISEIFKYLKLLKMKNLLTLSYAFSECFIIIFQNIFYRTIINL